MHRSAGVVLPLFSIRTRRDWGIGQITDLPACAAWLRRSGHRLLQVLPPHELSEGESSPYSALTAFGLDPIYADVEAIVDLDPAAILDALGPEGQRSLGRLRGLARVDYKEVRALKCRALHRAFERFQQREWATGSERAKQLERFVAEEAAWLSDLALYSALRETHAGWGWSTWPPEERERSPAVLDAKRRELGARILEVGYVQWTLLEQWAASRAAMRELGVELMGDLPFVVCEESADVWSRPSQFQLRMSLGAPPDDFSIDGQEWGLPPYDWREMDLDHLAWIRARARHASRLYDRFRMDHVVGYFRQWVREKHARGGRFDPEGDSAQRSRGARVLAAMLDAVSSGSSGDGGAVAPPRIIAEDLGVVPPFAREVLRELQMPGYRVLPWEKDDGTFRDPRAFPALSVASWSTHDTHPITAWWDELPGDDRAELAKRAGVREGADESERSLALLADLYGSGSDLVLVLAQELLGDRARLNTPATVSDDNWTWRLPRALEDLAEDPSVNARLDAVRELVDRSGRGSGPTR